MQNKPNQDFSLFAEKTLLITGGTGSFGNAVLRRFLESDIGEIRIFSRDEAKQDHMRRRYKNPKLKFYLGDVRDPQSLGYAMKGVDFVYHAAALKQVPSCEFYPLEAVKTNILGTENVLEVAIREGVKKVVCLSTDKAVYPINAMGISKAMMEKVVVAKSRLSESTIVCATRYGNVMASRGSVIPLFVKQIRSGQPPTITDPSMTRFMMSLDDAVDLVLFAFEHGDPGEIFVQKAPAANIQDLACALNDIFGAVKNNFVVIGTRHGEKQFEVLLSREEMAFAEDLGQYFRISPDRRDLDYGKFFDQGEKRISDAVEYTSHNTEQLDVDGVKKMLMKLPFIQNAIGGLAVEAEE